MGVGGRSVLAVLMAGMAYAMYIYFPNEMLQYATGDTIDISGAKIVLGDFDNLLYYLTFIGYLIVGCTFAGGMAASETAPKAIWKIIGTLLAIVFWGIFIYADFNLVDISTVLGSGADLLITLDITVLFWVMMGGNIFELIVGGLDLAISFSDEKEEF